MNTAVISLYDRIKNKILFFYDHILSIHYILGNNREIAKLYVGSTGGLILKTRIYGLR